MEYAVVIAVVGGLMLLVGAGAWLLVRPLFRRTGFAVLAVFASATSLLLAVTYTLDGRFFWPGAVHVAMAVGWLVVLRLNQRTVRT